MTDTALTLQTDPSLLQTPSLPTVSKKAHYTPDQARKVAQDFEAVFLSQMIQPMFEGLELEEPFGGGSSESTWRSLQVQEYGKALAKNGGIGIADSVMKQLLHMQETRADQPKQGATTTH